MYENNFFPCPKCNSLTVHVEKTRQQDSSRTDSWVVLGYCEKCGENAQWIEYIRISE